MATCPVSQQSYASDPSARCPVAHADTTTGINPLNNVPLSLSQNPAPHQTTTLSTKREHSSIPRALSAGEELDQSSKNWVYPSPQQFFNALNRKGYDMPENQMATMVKLHNFLNEEAWAEVLRWERRWDPSVLTPPQLAQIRGKPKELTWKARSRMFGAWLVPSHFEYQKPFDRHDWVIRRANGQEVRYIIDYYSSDPDEHGNPAFLLDVRPASDSVANLYLRSTTAANTLWNALTWREEKANL